MADFDTVELDDFNARIIRQMAEVKERFAVLQTRLNQKKYFIEYEQHRWTLQAQEHGSLPVAELDISAGFSKDIMIPFVEANSRYLGLKQELIMQKCLTRDEVAEIESEVLASAGKSEEDLSKMLFFPAFQKKHLVAADDHKQLLLQRQESLNFDIHLIRSEYTQKSRFYKKLHFGASVLSLVGIGLPILLGGLMAHLITKLSARAKIASINRRKNENNHHIANNIHPALDALHDEIRQNESHLLKQSFFTAAKAKHDQKIDKLEQYFPGSPRR